MRSQCKIIKGVPICTAKNRGSQKYCDNAMVDAVHLFCGCGNPGSKCGNYDAIKEALEEKE